MSDTTAEEPSAGAVLEADHHRIDTLQHELVRLGDSVAGRLRGAGVAGRTISIKVRFHDFRTITRSVTLPQPVDTAPAIVRAAGEVRIDGELFYQNGAFVV